MGDKDQTCRLNLDPELLGAIIEGTTLGLQMAEVEPRPVGASELSSAHHAFSVSVGLVGRHSGSMVLNLSQRAMLFLAGRLLGEAEPEVSEETIDAIMEIGNMVGGSIKTPLRGTGYEISQISLPSLIMGQSFRVLYARGIQTVSVEFEIPEIPYSSLGDRFFTTSVSLLRGSGG